jgi:hypothetical protein
MRTRGAHSACRVVVRIVYVCATLDPGEVEMAKAAAGETQRETPRDKLKPVKSVGRAGSKRDAKSELGEILTVAQQRGLLSGSRTHVIRGRMPVALVEQAKLKTGISSDSKLLEAALANLAVSDDYARWLLAQRGTVSPALDLEF